MKHINIWYFFITNRVSKGNVSVVWCPTGDMTGDYATKPLQGKLFKKFRDQVMGVVPVQDPGPGKPKPKSSKKDTIKSKPKSGKTKLNSKVNSMVPPGSRTKKGGTTGVCWDKVNVTILWMCE